MKSGTISLLPAAHATYAASAPPPTRSSLGVCAVTCSASPDGVVACGTRGAPPLPDQLASFYKLVDKKIVAGQLGRHARDAELSALASVLAEALFGNDSLVVADQQIGESESLHNLALLANGAEQEALHRQAWALLFLVVALLLRRLAANTLLPGTIREEELEYIIYEQ